APSALSAPRVLTSVTEAPTSTKRPPHWPSELFLLSAVLTRSVLFRVPPLPPSSAEPPPSTPRALHQGARFCAATPDADRGEREGGEVEKVGKGLDPERA